MATTEVAQAARDDAAFRCTAVRADKDANLKWLMSYARIAYRIGTRIPPGGSPGDT